MATGLLDTSVVIDWDDPLVLRALPDQISVSAITLAELAAGPILAASVTEQSSRQARLQQAEATFEPIPFDAAAARSFGQVVAAIASTGRSHRSRMADLLIAATAHANGLTLYTRNPDDFLGLENLIQVVAV
jgi:predicted nucleic acid-binding protein